MAHSVQLTVVGKGKVERGVGYLKRSFLEGRAFVGVDDLNQQLEVWLDTVANVRVHGTTKVRPVDRFAEDQAAVRPLAAVPAFDVRPVEHRQVGNDSHLSYGSVLYSAHPDAAGHTVIVRPEGDHVGAVFTVYLGDQVVARHRLRPKDSLRVTLPEHASAIRQQARRPRAARAPRRAPAFDQRPEPPLAPQWPPELDPDVQQRTLDAYEAMAAS